MPVFDTREYVKKFTDAGFAGRKADALAQVFLEFTQLLVTKDEFHCEIRDLEKRVLLKTGAMIASAVVLQTALTALMFQFWLPR